MRHEQSRGNTTKPMRGNFNVLLSIRGYRLTVFDNNGLNATVPWILQRESTM